MLVLKQDFIFLFFYGQNVCRPDHQSFNLFSCLKCQMQKALFHQQCLPQFSEPVLADKRFSHDGSCHMLSMLVNYTDFLSTPRTYAQHLIFCCCCFFINSLANLLSLSNTSTHNCWCFLLHMQKKLDGVGPPPTSSTTQSIFKALALWDDAFYKSICPYVCLSLCSLLRYRLTSFCPQFSKSDVQIFQRFRILGEK